MGLRERKLGLLNEARQECCASLSKMSFFTANYATGLHSHRYRKATTTAGASQAGEQLLAGAFRTKQAYRRYSCGRIRHAPQPTQESDLGFECLSSNT